MLVPDPERIRIIKSQNRTGSGLKNQSPHTSAISVTVWTEMITNRSARMDSSWSLNFMQDWSQIFYVLPGAGAGSRCNAKVFSGANQKILNY